MHLVVLVLAPRLSPRLWSLPLPFWFVMTSSTSMDTDSSTFAPPASAIPWDTQFAATAVRQLRALLPCLHCKAVGHLRSNGSIDGKYLRLVCESCTKSSSASNDFYSELFEANLSRLSSSASNPTSAAFFAAYAPSRPSTKRARSGASSSTSAPLPAPSAPADATVPSGPMTQLAPFCFEAIGSKLFAFLLHWKSLPGVTVSDATVTRFMSLLQDVARAADSVLAAAVASNLLSLAESIGHDFEVMSTAFVAAASTPAAPAMPAQASVPPASPPRSYAEATRSAPSPAASEAWQRIGRNGRPQPPPPSPSTSPRMPRWQSVQVTDDMRDRFWRQSKKCHRNELAWLYVQGLPRDQYWKLRALFDKEGMPQTWFRELAFTRDGVLEMLVHAERADTILETFHELGHFATADLADLELLRDAEWTASTVARLLRRLDALPARAVGVRYHVRQRVAQLQDRDAPVDESMGAAQ